VQNGTSRRLAAIVVGDIADYSRLIGGNEEGTRKRVHELVGPTIAEHRGHLLKTMGDGFLAMFDSPVEAVRCAIVIQQSMLGRNQDLPQPQWIRYRIGVNLGDVILDKDDIYGDGINIAARLEQLAEPGSVYISGGVYEQIKYKLVAGYQSLGDRKVKNITDPVPIYRVLPDPTAFIRATRRQRWRKAAIAATALLAVAGLGGGGWYVWRVQAKQESAKSVDAFPAQVSAEWSRAPSPSGPEPTPQNPASPPIPTSPQPSGAQSLQVVPPPAESVSPAPSQSPPATSTQEAAIVPPLSRPAPRPDKPSIKEPDMVALPGGTFRMGSHDDPSEQPIHRVTVKPFLIGRYPVTVKQWRDCVAANSCANLGTGDDNTPVFNLSWDDAQHYTEWLSQVTGKKYRLPTEAEWEYAARAGAETPYWWGSHMVASMADCKGCGGPYDPQKPLAVGSLKANSFGIYDVAGGIAQWVADCWHKDYHGAPQDGSAWESKDCAMHVLHGGSWRSDAASVRASSRESYDTTVRYPGHGLRVARSQ
jgi:formylglycine-generating enzyme required for sulfatase activity/class 3 adenylate cyclase